MPTPPRKTVVLVLGSAAVISVVAATSAGAATLITGAQIKNNTVTGADIRNGSLTTLDIATSAQAALRGQTGAQGVPGAKGDTGAVGISGYELVFSGTTYLPAGQFGNSRATCPSGKRIISGGPFFDGDGPGLYAVSSVPDKEGALPTTANVNAWYVRAYNGTGVQRTVTTYAICANIS